MKKITFFYSFNAMDENNKKIHGVIDATNKTIAHYVLSNIGLKEIKRLQPILFPNKKCLLLNTIEKRHFIRELNTLLKSGVPLLDSILALKNETSLFRLKYFLFSIANHLNEGRSLSTALEKITHNPFSDSEIHLFKMSEMSGNFESSLQFIETTLSRKELIRKKMISALIYPSITLAISFIVMFIIFYWVIPQFSDIFSKSKQPLPWITQCLFSISTHITQCYIGIIALLCIVGYTAKHLYYRKKISLLWQEKCLLFFPIFKIALLLANRVHFTYSMFTLLHAGIPIDKAFDESIKHIYLPYTRECLKKTLPGLYAGKSLSFLLKDSSFFTPSAIQTILTAEKTGHLEQAFSTLSQHYTEELSTLSDHVGKIIEPFIILALGVMIGFIVIAIYLPIFQLGNLY